MKVTQPGGVVRGGRSTRPEETARVHAAVAARHTAWGWRYGEGYGGVTYSSSVVSKLKEHRPLREGSLFKWDQRMGFMPGGCRAVAFGEGEPLGVEVVAARLREAVATRCAERGWDPAERVGAELWEALCDDPGASPPGCAQPPLTPYDPVTGAGRDLDLEAAARVDARMEWTPGTAEWVALHGDVPVPATPAPQAPAVPAPPDTATAHEVIVLAGGIISYARDRMSPAERGRIAETLRRALDEWRAGRSGEGRAGDVPCSG
jgi:hypothetical protein